MCIIPLYPKVDDAKSNLSDAWSLIGEMKINNDIDIDTIWRKGYLRALSDCKF